MNQTTYTHAPPTQTQLIPTHLPNTACFYQGHQDQYDTTYSNAALEHVHHCAHGPAITQYTATRFWNLGVVSLSFMQQNERTHAG